jgi:hypothetical protein
MVSGGWEGPSSLEWACSSFCHWEMSLAIFSALSPVAVLWLLPPFESSSRVPPPCAIAGIAHSWAAPSLFLPHWSVTSCSQSLSQEASFFALQLPFKLLGYSHFFPPFYERAASQPEGRSSVMVPHCGASQEIASTISVRLLTQSLKRPLLQSPWNFLA